MIIGTKPFFKETIYKEELVAVSCLAVLNDYLWTIAVVLLTLKNIGWFIHCDDLNHSIMLA